MEETLNRFCFFCDNMKDTLGKKVHKKTLLKLYKVMVIMEQTADQIRRTAETAEM
jgi:hypothetical protein